MNISALYSCTQCMHLHKKGGKADLGTSAEPVTYRSKEKSNFTSQRFREYPESFLAFVFVLFCFSLHFASTLG